MGFRFRKSLRLFPGVRLNLSKSGASVSVGPRGLRYTVGPKGTRVTAGIPGTGLSVSQYTPYAKPSLPRTPAPAADFALAPADGLRAIESAAAEKINQLSTSELAPILHSAQRRRRFSRIILALCILIFVLAFLSKDQVLIGAAALLTTIFVPAAIFLDRYRRSVRIDYRPDETSQKIAAALEESFADLRACHYVWNISAEGRTEDWKRNAGATKTSKRERVYPSMKRPSCIRGGASFPSCIVGKEELYFLPDALLVVTPSSVAALKYKDFLVSLTSIRFIEEENVPRDTSVIDQTWRFVNKNGGPDRRFNSNKHIPVCLYGELSFSSPGGLNEILHLSSPSAAEMFVEVIEVLRGFEAPSEAKSIKSFRKARRGLSTIFWISFLIVALPLAALALVTLQDQHGQARLHTSSAIHDRSTPISGASAAASGATSAAQSHSRPASRLENVPLPRPRPIP